MALRTWLVRLGGVLRTSPTGWLVVAALAVLGTLFGIRQLGWHRVTSVGTWTGRALIQTALLVLGIGWLLLLIAAVGLTLYIARWPSKAAWLSARTTLRRRMSDVTPIRDGDVTAIGVALRVAPLLASGLTAIFWLPQRLIPRTETFAHEDRLKVMNDVRGTLLQAAAYLGGLIAAIRARLTVN